MGMYDSIIIKKFKCPNCAKIMDECELQTKDLHNVLDNYNFPDVIKESWGPSWEDVSKVPYKPPRQIFVAGDCKFCKSFFGGQVFIKQKVLYKYQFINSKSKKITSERECWYEGLKESLERLSQSKIDTRELKNVIKALIFSVYNGDALSPENMQLLDNELKLKVLTETQDKIGKQIVDDFMTLGPASKYHSLLHQKTTKKT